MIHSVHAGYNRRQDLRGANVGGGFFTANVLLAGLQCQTVRGVAVHVHTHAHQAARHGAFEIVTARQVSRVRAAGTHGHAKSLGSAHHNVGVQFAGGCDQGEGQQIGGHDEGGLRGMGLCNGVFQIVNHAGGGRVLRDHCKVIMLLHEGWRKSHQHIQTQRRCACLNHLNGLGVAIAGHNDVVAFRFDRALGQGHGFGSRRGFVQHRCVGNGHGG